MVIFSTRDIRVLSFRLDLHGVNREGTNQSRNDCVHTGAQSKADPPAQRRQKPSPARRGTLLWVTQDPVNLFSESC